MSGENAETLHLVNLERQNIGEYSCSSKNEVGENHSSTISLRVQCMYYVWLLQIQIHIQIHNTRFCVLKMQTN